ncbi:MAG: competence/damage-inducible protein A [Planctomycetota bacterium]
MTIDAEPSIIHSHAVILAVGDELTLGQKLDSNSQWLSQQLTHRNIRIVEHRTVPDDLDQLTEAFVRGAATASLILVTGGLGPTLDDLTRDALAKAMNEELVEDPKGIEMLRAFAEKMGRPMPNNNNLQARRPASAGLIPNSRGTAPGLAATINNACSVFCMPGPPSEMRKMFEAFVVPELHPPTTAAVSTRVLQLFGKGESTVAQELGELMHRDANPLVGTTASHGILSIRIRYEGSPDEAEGEIERIEREIRWKFEDILFAADDHPIEHIVLDHLKAREEMIAVAESCTGGLLGSMLTEVPGSSAAFAGGHITYSNAMKQHALGVHNDLLEAYGAVSEPVALAMARGCLTHTPGADHALSITGVAGPSGGTEAKPVGTVCIARASADDTTEARRFRFPGSRPGIRKRACQAALAMLAFHMIGKPTPPTLWDRPE